MHAQSTTYAELIAALGEERERVVSELSALQDRPCSELNELRAERCSRQEVVLAEAIRILLASCGGASGLDRLIASLPA